MSRIALLLSAIGIVINASGVQVTFAEVRLPGVFSDHMVLQRDQELPIWGTGAPGEEIMISINEQTQTTNADDDGKWQVMLKPLKVGGPHVLTIKGSNLLEIKDVLIGDVWIGSGQSNMAGGVRGYEKADATLAKLAERSYPNLRLCRGNGGRWQEATPEAIGGFSALLFSFGQELQQELDIPVGVISGAVGGTPSGRWLTEEMLKSDSASQELIKARSVSHPFEKLMEMYESNLAAWEKEAAAAKQEGKQPPKPPAKPVKVGEIRSGKIGDLYQANIQPIVPFAIRGVLWDQGESGTALEGLDQFTVMGALIHGWRDAWGQGEFPFLCVQKPSGGGCAWESSDPVTSKAEAFSVLPPKNPDNGDGLYRELHIRIMEHPNTAMVTSTDLGSGVHPTNKSGYGQRAARVALGMAYDRPLEYYGPLYRSHKVEGNKVRVLFSHVGQGLAWKHGDALQGFEIAGADGTFVWGEAEIDGDTVLVSSDKVDTPVAVRYAWSQKSPWANLFNKDGLPALTFRSQRD